MFDDFLQIENFSIEVIEYTNPLELYENLQRSQTSVLLIGNGDKSNSRYALIGNHPNAITSFDCNTSYFNDEEIDMPDAWQFMSETVQRFNVEDLPYPANLCGFVGYLSYEMAWTLEKLPKTTDISYQIPMLKMILFQEYFIFDNYQNSAWKVEFSFKQNRKKSFFKILENRFSVCEIESENSADTYLGKVKKIQNYIVAGDVYEVNLTQQIKGRFDGNAFSFFQKLYSINDAPYSCYFDFEDFQIASNSPELFLRANGQKVETRPIKGTIKKSNDIAEDILNQQILLNSEKDQAELFMIVDLLRNDLGKISEIGSVKVINPKKLEHYKNVHHLVGIVESKLKKGSDYIDLFKATFPGGSITGCPKIRSMEIIDELETYSRNLYTGTIFWMNKQFLNSSIVIRTAVIKNGLIFINSGGAITIDSDPEDEYEEMKTKIKNIMEVLGNDNIS